MGLNPDTFGGGGGSSYLYELLDVDTNIQYAPPSSLLVKDSSGKWTCINQSSLTPDLSGYATQLWVNSHGFLTSVTWNSITNRPSTLSGYGITDALTTEIM